MFEIPDPNAKPSFPSLHSSNQSIDPNDSYDNYTADTSGVYFQQQYDDPQEYQNSRNQYSNQQQINDEYGNTLESMDKDYTTTNDRKDTECMIGAGVVTGVATLVLGPIVAVLAGVGVAIGTKTEGVSTIMVRCNGVMK